MTGGGPEIVECGVSGARYLSAGPDRGIAAMVIGREGLFSAVVGFEN